MLAAEEFFFYASMFLLLVFLLHSLFDPAFLSTPYHPEEEKQDLTPSTFWISPSIKVL